jgi:carboxylesterase
LSWWGGARWRRAVAARFEQADSSRRPRHPNGVVIGAESIRLMADTGRAVLLLHGFNDTPQSVAYLAGCLRDAGFTVHAPRLPGHGCALPDMARDARADRWQDAVQEAWDTLAGDHDALYLCGQSMGGALAILHAARLGWPHPRLRAVALLAPFIGLPTLLTWRFRLAALSPAPYHHSRGGEQSLLDPDARKHSLGPGVVTAASLRALGAVAREARRALPRLKAPVLYLQSRQDNRIAESNAKKHFSNISATDKRQMWLDDSGHIISDDRERQAVAQHVVDWFSLHPAP